MTAPIRVCALCDLIDNQAKGFTVTLGEDGDNHRLDIIVVRCGSDVHAYVNSCPQWAHRLTGSPTSS